MNTSWDPYHELTDETLRHRLMRYAQKRLATSDAEDVVQQALCEAVAAKRVPDTADAIGPWLMTIVKRRICDWFRARRSSEVDADEALDAEGRYAARDLLRRVATESAGSNAQTLGWLVREFSGETIERIAKEDRLPAPVVRQRIHRFRRRARVLYLATPFVLAVLALGALAMPTTTAKIEADVASMPALDVATLEGTYEIDKLTVADDVAAGDKLLVEWARHSVVRITSDSVVIDRLKHRTLRIVPAPDDRIHVRADDGSEHALRATRAGDAIVIECLEGRFRGRVHLRRL